MSHSGNNVRGSFRGSMITPGVLERRVAAVGMQDNQDTKKPLTRSAGFDNVPQRLSGKALPPAHCHTGHSTGSAMKSAIQASREAAGTRAAWSPSYQSPPFDHAARATLGRQDAKASRRPRRPGKKVLTMPLQAWFPHRQWPRAPPQTLFGPND